MNNTLKNFWLLPTLRGILAIIFAVVLFAYPKHSLIFVIGMCGAFILVFGLFTLGMGFMRRHYDLFWKSYLGDGLVGVVIGLAVLLWPALTGILLIYLLACWALISGILQLISAWRLRQHIGSIGLNVGMGLLLILLGLIAFIHPSIGFITLSYFIGFAAMIYGIMALFFGLMLRKINN